MSTAAKARARSTSAWWIRTAVQSEKTGPVRRRRNRFHTPGALMAPPGRPVRHKQGRLRVGRMKGVEPEPDLPQVAARVPGGLPALPRAGDELVDESEQQVVGTPGVPVQETAVNSQSCADPSHREGVSAARPPAGPSPTISRSDSTAPYGRLRPATPRKPLAGRVLRQQR